MTSRGGAFIVVEGIDGVGKTSQVDRIFNYLVDKLNLGRVIRTKDLGGSKLGEILRKTMYEEVPIASMAPGVVDLLFLAGHVQNWHIIVKPALDHGLVVVSDRWWYSQFAYGAHRSTDPRAQTAYASMRGGDADVLIFLYGDPKILLARANARKDSTKHQHQKPWNFTDTQAKVAETYMKRYNQAPEWCPINVGERSEDEVWELVKPVVDDLLQRKHIDARQ